MKMGNRQHFKRCWKQKWVNRICPPSMLEETFWWQPLLATGTCARHKLTFTLSDQLRHLRQSPKFEGYIEKNPGSGRQPSPRNIWHARHSGKITEYVFVQQQAIESTPCMGRGFYDVSKKLKSSTFPPTLQPKIYIYTYTMICFDMAISPGGGHGLSSQCWRDTEKAIVSAQLFFFSAVLFRPQKV